MVGLAMVTADGVLRNKFLMDSIDALAPCPPEIIEKLRGTYARISLWEHVVLVSKGIYSFSWYYDTTSQEYVIKTETPHVVVNRGPLEYLLDELDELFCGDVA